MSEVLETARSVVDKSLHVRIDKQAITYFSQNLVNHEVKVPSWNSHYHFYDGGKNTVIYHLVLDTINFCFWPPPRKERWEIKYESKKLSGYYALAASLKRLVKSGVPFTNASYLADLSLVELKKILNGRGELQLIKDRLLALNELGNILLKEYKGHAYKLVESAGHSALKLVRLLADKLSSFNDIAEYQGQMVFFYKRAQIFAADLHGAFNGKSLGYFTDIDNLTAFADYKLPQVLRQLGILLYSAPLAQKVDREILLEAGSPEEIEIRANSIWAVELIRQELNQLGKRARPFEIDWILWNMGQGAEFKLKPYHRTLTIFY